MKKLGRVLAVVCLAILGSAQPAGATIAVAQAVHTLGIPSSGTISRSITVSSGSTIVALGCGLLGTTATLSFSDDGSGTWNNGVTLNPSNGIRKSVYSENRSGTITVTATFGSSNWLDRTLTLVEITGAATSSSLDQSTGQHLGTATGTDSVTSGNPSSTTNATDLVLGFAINYNDSKNASAGTGFTAASGSPFASDGNDVSVASKRVTSTGTYPALFTPSAGGSAWDVQVLIFKEAGGGGSPARDGQGFFGQPGLSWERFAPWETTWAASSAPVIVDWPAPGDGLTFAPRSHGAALLTL